MPSKFSDHFWMRGDGFDLYFAKYFQRPSTKLLICRKKAHLSNIIPYFPLLFSIVIKSTYNISLSYRFCLAQQPNPLPKSAPSKWCRHRSGKKMVAFRPTSGPNQDWCLASEKEKYTLTINSIHLSTSAIIRSVFPGKIFLSLFRKAFPFQDGWWILFVFFFFFCSLWNMMLAEIQGLPGRPAGGGWCWRVNSHTLWTWGSVFFGWNNFQKYRPTRIRLM